MDLKNPLHPGRFREARCLSMVPTIKCVDLESLFFAEGPGASGEILGNRASWRHRVVMSRAPVADLRSLESESPVCDRTLKLSEHLDSVI